MWISISYLRGGEGKLIDVCVCIDWLCLYVCMCVLLFSVVGVLLLTSLDCCFVSSLYHWFLISMSGFYISSFHLFYQYVWFVYIYVVYLYGPMVSI